jgi:hypothetical protein
MPQMFAAYRTTSFVAVLPSLMLLVCLGVGGCSQTVEAERAEAARVEEGKARRAELEAGCTAERYTAGTPDFQNCVGRASLKYANAGVSKAKMIHGTVKSAPDAYRAANAGLTLGRLAITVSDARAKRDLVRIGRLQNGIGLYRFTYVGGTRKFVGVIAQEVKKVAPEAVQMGPDGLLRVDYRQLGFRMMTWEEWMAATSVDRGVSALPGLKLKG